VSDFFHSCRISAGSRVFSGGTVTTVAVLVVARACGARFGCFAFETVACTVDRKALFVQQIPDTPDQQHFVMLIVTAVCPAV